ncbi:hypothetical protein [Chitinophaga pinensis]|uniref:Uncharacterized protein n=1 Tax=Chitinophaga pinensis TaxID=79329 RepID=A0A5C6LQD9_9BACT|nr:hypothetical protein [Chitinophaga pinensis]TWV98699.1 hypothetical protein FEF09_20680 [Chitinophaga pinensis]
MFTVNVNGHEKAAVKRQFTYWNDGTDEELAANDFLSNNNGFMKEVYGFRDFSGNTYIAGLNNYRKSRYGGVVMLRWMQRENWR